MYEPWLNLGFRTEGHLLLMMLCRQASAGLNPYPHDSGPLSDEGPYEGRMSHSNDVRIRKFREPDLGQLARLISGHH